METTLAAGPVPPGIATLAQDQSIRRIYTALTFLVCTAWLAAIAPQFLNDPDTFWHIRTGRDIWEGRHFPLTDSYSHSQYGQPWIAKEWLAQILLFAAYSIGSWNAVIGLAILAIATAGALLFHYLSLRLNPSLAIVVALTAVFFSSQTYLARPHVLAFPILVIWTEHVMRASEEDRSPPLLLALLLVPWASLNASFAIGLVIAGFGFLNFLQRTRGLDRRTAASWLFFIGASFLVTAIHPYGFAPLVTAITVFGGKDWLKGGEWRPIDAVTDPLQEMLLLGLLALALVAGLRLRASKAAFVVTVLHLFLSHVRFGYLFYFLTPLAISYEIAQQKPGLGAFRRQSPPPGGAFVILAKHSRSIAAVFSLLSAALIAHLLVLQSHHPAESITPAHALAGARSANVSGNVLNSGEFGGYLIFEGVKTYVDGRGDQLFDNAFLDEYSAAMRPGGEVALKTFLERYDISWTLLRTSDPIAPRMMDNQTNFRRIYEDETAIVHARVD